MLNMLTDSTEVLKNAFDTMEGSGFYKYSCVKEDYSLKSWSGSHAERSIASGSPTFLGDFVKKEEEAQKPCGTAIYGSGGLHRYFIRFGGDIYYSAMHSSKADVDTARSLGFGIIGS